jgi:hypothetical protein
VDSWKGIRWRFWRIGLSFPEEFQLGSLEIPLTALFCAELGQRLRFEVSSAPEICLVALETDNSGLGFFYYCLRIKISGAEITRKTVL